MKFCNGFILLRKEKFFLYSGGDTSPIV